MLYCIYHSENGIHPDHADIGQEISFVNKQVTAYLKGEYNVIVDGETYSIGDKVFQIYACDTLEAHIVESQINRFHALNKNTSIWDAVDSLFKNVTKEFLKGRSFGDLKEDLYNVYVKTNDKTNVATTIEKDEIISFLNSWHCGESFGYLGSERIELTNPNNLKIFDISIEHRKESNGETKKYINYDVRVLRKGWSIAALEYFGKEVTSDFKVKGYGTLKSISSLKGNRERIEQQQYAPTNHKKIFISHSSKDKDIVTKFVHEILVLSLCAKQSSIFCTSIDGMGISSGQDFRDRIKKELNESLIVIQMISKNYKSSEVCLNEMGAAWVLADYVIPLVIDEQYDVGFINSTTHQLSLAKKSGITQFIDDWEHLFPHKSNMTKINSHIDEFLKVFFENGTPLVKSSSNNNYDIQDPDFQMILTYFKKINVTMVSFQKIAEMVHQKFTENYLMSMVEKYPTRLRKCKLKGNLFGIEIISG